MARDKKPKQSPELRKQQRNINKLAKGIQSNMDSLYQQTYYSSPTMKTDLTNLANQINAGIDRITNVTKDTVGVPNISKLYNRIIDTNHIGGTNSVESIASMFQDNTFMDDMYDSFMGNFVLKEMDEEIDAVCRYMPKLLEALETRKDNVLSADHFSKDFLTVNSDNISEDSRFNSEIAALKKKYNLLRFVEDLYDNTAKYGEQMVYIVPYKQAMQRLLARKPNTQFQPTGFREECIAQGINYDAILEGAARNGLERNSVFAEFKVSNNRLVLSEATTHREISSESIDFGNNKEFSGLDLKIEINRTNIVESAVREKFNAVKASRIIREESLWHEASRMTPDQKKDYILQTTDAKGSLSFDGLEEPSEHKNKDKTKFSALGSDGLFSNDYAMDPDKIKIEVPGCVLRVLDHTLVHPIYMDDTCMGFYYIEFFAKESQANNYGFTNITGDPLTAASPEKAGALYNNINASKQDMLAKYLSGQLAEFIDANFINANQDLRDEIYVILKQNDVFNSPNLDRLKVTYIPPDEMIHVFFRQNKITHRGISDLDRAMVPAKIYSSLYITQGIGNLTRGQDKRVYYVKQQVETNIARTLLNTVQQIKMGNFGLRQFKSINSVLNVTGRFNDYIIPTNSSGDSPIQFEVMPKQNWAA